MANIIQTQRLCRTCQQYRLFTKPAPSHLIHALVTLFTCGAWAFVWILIAILSAFTAYRCSQCGSTSH